MIYIVIWALFIFWYVCMVISPNCFHDIREESLQKEIITEKSKLFFVYLNKKVYPKLKTVAIITIILFIMNLLFSITWLFISYYLKNDSIIKYGEIIYILLLILVGSFPIIKFNLNK